MTVRKKKKDSRIKGLDGIRTLALLGVLLYHTFPNTVSGGFFGVILFFVVTGYLAAVSGMKSWKEGTFSIKGYYIKRIKRLYPELIVVMLCTIGVMTFAAPYKMANTQGEFLSVMLGYNNFWQIGMNANYFAQLAKSSPFTHLWYIAVLLQFEVLWPWLFTGYTKISEKKGPGTALLTAMAVTAVTFLIMPVSVLIRGSAALTAVYYSTFTRIFSIFAGVCTGFIHSMKMSLFPNFILGRRRAGWALTGYIVFIVLLYFFAKGTSLWVYYIGMALATIVGCRMIEIVFHRRNMTARYMDNIFCKAISKYSYEIYLWQYPVLMIAGLMGFSSKWWHYMIQIAAIIILSIWLYAFNSEVQKRIR